MADTQCGNSVGGIFGDNNNNSLLFFFLLLVVLFCNCGSFGGFGKC